VNRDTLHTLSKQDLVSLIEAQAAQIEAQTAQITSLMARIAELEARLSAPPKTPDNSSTPPSKGQKANLPDRVKSRRGGRAGVSRALSEHPDRIIEATLSACPHCGCVLGSADQPDTHAYDHIELPAISPTVTRINRHRGVCPCCRRQVTAAAPKGFEPGSPFGPGLCALIIHLHVTQAISFERLVRLLAEVFGLTISEGAIANILSRAGAPLLASAVPIADAVRPCGGGAGNSARASPTACAAAGRGPGTSGISTRCSSGSRACSTISGAPWIRTALCSTSLFRTGAMPMLPSVS
jgi:transposase